MEQLRLPDELLLPSQRDLVCGCQPLEAVQVNARAEIVRLRAAGYSAAEAARSLNRRGIATPSGRGRWHPDTVRRHADPAVRQAWARYMADYRARHPRTG